MKTLHLLFLIFTSNLCVATYTKPDTVTRHHTAQTLDQYLSALNTLGKFNGVFLACKNDSLLIHKAYTIATGPSSLKISRGSQFDIHSVSKLMLHYLIVKLEKEGLISQSNLINKYFPDFPNGEKITVEMLLKHQSGLPREFAGFDGNESDLSSSEIIALAKSQSLLFEPGKGTQYSNIGYEVLYEIIARTMKKSFAQCVMDEIFVPLNMDHSGAHFYVRLNRLEDLAKNHVLDDSSITVIPNILEDEFKTSRIFSTAHDLHLYLEQIRQEPYASALQNSDGIIEKNGGSDGVRAQIYTSLRDSFSFVLLTNYEEIPFAETIRDVVKILKGETVEMPRELNRTSIELEAALMQAYEGEYAFPDLGNLVLKIVYEDQSLLVIEDGERVATLRAESPTVFFENPKAAESFQFIRNADGTYEVLMGWKGITLKGVRK